MSDVNLRYPTNRAVLGAVVDTDDLIPALQAENVASTVATVTLTAAQIKALNTTPIALVPAQGAGTVILVENIFGKSVGATAAFTGANALEFRYTGTAGAQVSADLPAATFINATDAQTLYGSAAGVATALVPVPNSGIFVRVPTANPGGATAAGTITLTVIYKVLSV